MKILFLDIDGVLNRLKPQRNGYCGFDPICVENLNYVLLTIPDLYIVISSSWRYMISPRTMTLEGFEFMLLASGVCCKARVAGATVRDDAIPERSDQVKHWLDTHPEVTKHLALDDMCWEFGSRNVISLRTDSHVGLTEKESKQIINHFKS